MLFRIYLSFAILVFATPLSAQTNFKTRIEQTAIEKGKTDAERMHSLFALTEEIEEDIYPEANTWKDKPKHQDKWTDMSLPAIENRNETLRQMHQAFSKIDRSKLSKTDQLNYDLFSNSLARSIEGFRYPGHLMPITHLGGLQTSVPQLFPVMRFQNEQDYRNYLLRLERLPSYLDQHIALMQQGLKQGIMPARVSMDGVPDQVTALLTTDTEKSLVLQPVQKFPAGIPEAKQKDIKAAAEKTAREKINPAVQRLHTFLEKTYLPKTRENIAFTSLPNGANWYNYSIKGHTTTNLTYQQIHDIGQAEVKRIRGEMEKVIASTGFKGSFAEFSEFLRTDPQFYHTTPEELINGYLIICKKLDAEMPRFFGILPRMTYGVKEIPANQAKTSPTAYYNRGSKEAARPGYFFANTYDLKSRPKWGMESLAIHEAVPGHHLQIAIAQELENLPEFRKNSGYTAYIEGWGLYSESLGDEMGFYKDPYSKFGQLSAEMWRALRLVTDTGMHGLGWSRQQAIDIFKANTPIADHDIAVEIDRYISMPGQALAYKIGELKIKELRAKATTELGDKFDLRQFHDVVLGSGALPLDVLEKVVNEWIVEKKRA